MVIKAAPQTVFDVGGVLLTRPFKVRRLGHFGLNNEQVTETLHFYVDMLGFRISDSVDLKSRSTSPERFDGLTNTKIYFTRYGTDHHSFVIDNEPAIRALRPGRPVWPEMTISQISWQVGSLAEVANAARWIREGQRADIGKTGRDMPGSNWHVYFRDPEGHNNELYYGMEQVGWDGWSKPEPMHDRGFHEPPPLPQISEAEEIRQAQERGIGMASGHQYIDPLPAKYDVDGILLPRPFRVVRVGPLRLFVNDLDRIETFYRETMGFALTEEVVWNGYRCVFLRANNEHHSLALYPKPLRQMLGLSPHTTCMSFAMQVATYRQLRDALAFLQAQGYTVRELPPELSPGIDYSAYVMDPGGHAIQLYYQMEQVGWTGQPRPSEMRSRLPLDQWPDQVEAQTDTYAGEIFMGPLG